MWLDIVLGFADDIENSGQLIKMIFYNTDYTDSQPYCFWISNCTYINDSGQVRYFEGDKVCYLSFDDDYGEYNVLDIIESLNVENIQINSAAISDKQAFADTLKKTDIKRLFLFCKSEVVICLSQESLSQTARPDTRRLSTKGGGRPIFLL